MPPTITPDPENQDNNNLRKSLFQFPETLYDGSKIEKLEDLLTENCKFVLFINVVFKESGPE